MAQIFQTLKVSLCELCQGQISVEAIRLFDRRFCSGICKIKFIEQIRKLDKWILEGGPPFTNVSLSAQVRYYHRNKIRLKAYRQSHKEQYRRNNIVYYHDHREQMLRRSAIYRANHRDEINRKQREKKRLLRSLKGNV